MTSAAQRRDTGITPFWNRLGAITRYPAQMAALLTIILFGLANLLIYLPLGSILVLLATVGMYRYAFECLRTSADGRLEPPEFALSDDSGLGWKQIGLMIILLVVVALVRIKLGPKAGTLALVLAGLALPGATITLAMEESLLAALNPVRWVSIVTRIGWPYLAVAGLCLVIFASQRYAAAMAAQVLPTFVALVAVGIIANYALVVVFHLMGYLVYQYHDELGYVPDEPMPAGPLTPPDPDQGILDEAADLVRGGSPEDATRLLRGHLNGRGGSHAVHTQYRKLMHLTDDKEGLLRHGRAYLPMLLAQNKDREALELLKDCHGLDAGFAPTEAADVGRLARLAAQRGDAHLALELLSGFHQRFPKSPDVVGNYLLAATLLHERLNKDEQARQLLLSLKQNFPDNPLMPQIEQRLAQVEQMMAASQRTPPKG